MTDRPLTQRWVESGYERYLEAVDLVRWTGAVTVEGAEGTTRDLFPVVGLRPTPQLRALEARQYALHDADDGLTVNWRWAAMWPKGTTDPLLALLGVELEYPDENERVLVAWNVAFDAEFLETCGRCGMLAWTTAPRLTENAWKRALCFEFAREDVEGIMAFVRHRAPAARARRPIQQLRPRARGRRSELQRQPGRRR